MKLTERFAKWAEVNAPEWGAWAATHVTHGGLDGVVSAAGEGFIYFDPTDDRASAEFRELCERELEGMGYFKFTYYRSAPGLPAELYVKGPARLPERYGSGSIKTAAVMEALMQAWETTNA